MAEDCPKGGKHDWEPVGDGHTVKCKKCGKYGVVS